MQRQGLAFVTNGSVVFALEQTCCGTAITAKKNDDDDDDVSSHVLKL